MSPQKSKSGPATIYFDKSDLRQYHKKQAIKQAEKFKKDAIAAANAPLSSCAIIAVLILAAIVVSPIGVLVLLA